MKGGRSAALGRAIRSRPLSSSREENQYRGMMLGEEHRSLDGHPHDGGVFHDQEVGGPVLVCWSGPWGLRGRLRSSSRLWRLHNHGPRCRTRLSVWRSMSSRPSWGRHLLLLTKSAGAAK